MSSNLNSTIPTIDLSPFFQTTNDSAKKEAMQSISHACRNYGFFRVLNHGMPVELMSKAIQLSKTFFDQLDDVKLKAKPVAGSKAPLPCGYARQPDKSPDKNEYLLMFSPESGFNVYPEKPSQFRSTLDECYAQLSQVALLLESILNECIGLPPSSIRNYNKEGGSDFMIALRYFPATDHDNNGIAEHEDGNCISLVLEDDVGGLEVLKDGEWISVEPIEGSIVVNVGDVVQVLTNNKFKSATHRVVRKEKYRHSFVFFFNADGEKWIEPLPQFTAEIGVLPEYKGFLYNEYMQLRMRNKTHPPSRPEDIINISHYAINKC